jgi:hypothetical protein
MVVKMVLEVSQSLSCVLFPYICSLQYVNQPKTFITCEGLHVVVTASIHMKRMAVDGWREIGRSTLESAT